MDEPITWQSVLGGAALTISSLVGYIVHRNDKRIDDIEETADGAVTSEALEVHRREDRENFISLFKGQEDINKSIGEGFRHLDNTISGMHVELLKQINQKADR